MIELTKLEVVRDWRTLERGWQEFHLTSQTKGAVAGRTVGGQRNGTHLTSRGSKQVHTATSEELVEGLVAAEPFPFVSRHPHSLLTLILLLFLLLGKAIGSVARCKQRKLRN